MRRVSLVILTFVILAAVGGSSSAATFINWPAYLFRPTHTSRNPAATAITTANASSLVKAWTWKPARPTMTLTNSWTKNLPS